MHWNGFVVTITNCKIYLHTTINTLIVKPFLYYANYRKLGEVGQKFGSSLILTHLKQLPSGRHVLNVANAGLGEAILLHGRHVEVLASPHFPSSSKEEIARITGQMGFISEVRQQSLYMQACRHAYINIHVLRCRTYFLCCITLVITLGWSCEWNLWSIAATWLLLPSSSCHSPPWCEIRWAPPRP